jgi:hypothetical protein
MSREGGAAHPKQTQDTDCREALQEFTRLEEAKNNPPEKAGRLFSRRGFAAIGNAGFEVAQRGEDFRAEWLLRLDAAPALRGLFCHLTLRVRRAPYSIVRCQP